MEIPKKAIIGTQIWTIVERTRTSDGMLSETTFGYTLNQENIIVVDKLSAPSRKRQVLMHELFHAMRFTFGGDFTPTKKDDIETWEHYFITFYEEGILLLLRNNPDILAYLLEME